jgi:hypothetical protein
MIRQHEEQRVGENDRGQQAGANESISKCS